MKIVMSWVACAAVALIVGWGVPPALAKDPSGSVPPPANQLDHAPGVGGEAAAFGFVACGNMLCVDVYQLKCLGPALIAHAGVTDDDGAGDEISVSLVALKPGKIKGRSAQRVTEPTGLGTFSGYAEIVRPTPGSMEFYVLVSNVTDIFVSYILDAHCHLPSFALGADRLTQIQNE